jgi:hypothetical protein
MYTHRKIYAHVAKAIGCRALIVHYGRAPENVHPGPVNDTAGSALQQAAAVHVRSAQQFLLITIGHLSLLIGVANDADQDRCPSRFIPELCRWVLCPRNN